MRIGVDARCLSGELTGIGRYVREILLRLDQLMPEAEWILYSRRPITLEWPSQRWQVRVDMNPFWRRLPGVLWIKMREATLAKRDRIDVFWATQTLSPMIEIPVLASIHDLNHVLVPETMPPVNRFAYRHWFADDVSRAALVVTNSQGTAARLYDLLGRRADQVALPGTRWISMADPRSSVEKIEAPYILAVATHEPRKNLATLIAAFAKLKAEGQVPEHVLVVVGAKGWGRKASQSDFAAPSWLRELGYVADASMASLFANADLFVQPSHYEGFGMPAAEAASFGKRVVATDIPELREAAGSNGIFVPPNLDSLAEGIEQALALPSPSPDPGHSWDETAKAMKQALYGAIRRQEQG